MIGRLGRGFIVRVPQRIFGEFLQIQFKGFPQHVGVDHGIIACLCHGGAENFRIFGELFAGNVVGPRLIIQDAFRVVNHRKLQGISLEILQDEVRFFPGLFFVDRLGEEINAHVKTGGLCILDVPVKFFVQTYSSFLSVAAVAKADESKAEAVVLQSLPVNIALMFGDVHA